VKRNSTLIPLTKETKIYARPDGTHYHLSRDCHLLRGREFDRFAYVVIDIRELRKRKLEPCVCAYDIIEEG
jgi:hypothetical protein